MSADTESTGKTRRQAVAQFGKNVMEGVGGAAAGAGEAAGKAGKAAIVKAKQAVEKAKDTISEQDIESLLATIYQQVLDGIPKVSPSVVQLAEDYRSKTPTTSKAARALINNQTIKCATSGFLTGLGGVITLPVAIPANVGSVLYVQMRMVAAIAYLGGFDVSSDQVQTLVYVCLTGSSASTILKGAGIKFGEKVAQNAIKAIPGKTLTAINQRVGFRFLTKFGEKGIINLGKLVPVVGGVLGGGFDAATTRVIANNAYKLFIEKEFPVDENDAVVFE